MRRTDCKGRAVGFQWWSGSCAVSARLLASPPPSQLPRSLTLNQFLFSFPLPSWSVGRQLDGVLVRCIQMASDIFAKIGDIKGESPDAKHKGEIEVLSFSWGVTNAANIGAGGGAGAGRATFNDLSFTHTIDKASPKLLEACATGAHLKEGTITRRKAGKGQEEYLIIKMNDIIVTSVSLGDSSGGAGSENVSLAFAKVDLEYRPQNPNGTLEPGIHFKFDIKANKDG